MGIFYKQDKYKIAKHNEFFELPFGEVATYQEMEDYIMSMEQPILNVEENDLILTFTPFPEKYVNYIIQNQYTGKRTQVYWQLARYMGKNIGRMWDKGEMGVLPEGNPRLDPTSELYRWTLPMNSFSNEGTYISWIPKFYTMTPQQARTGRIIWEDGLETVHLFNNRPWGAKDGYHKQEVALIIGLAHNGMHQGYHTFKRSTSYLYDNGNISKQDIIDALEDLEIILTTVENEEGWLDSLNININNIDENILKYLEKYPSNPNKGLFIQLFNYYGGTDNKGLQDGKGRGKTKSPSKPEKYRIFLTKELIQEEINMPITNEISKLKSRYLYEEETFHNISVAVILANKGMNEGYDDYKESNVVNILDIYNRELEW